MLSPIHSVTSSVESNAYSMQPTLNSSTTRSLPSSSSTTRRTSLEDRYSVTSNRSQRLVDSSDGFTEGCLVFNEVVNMMEGQGEVMCLHYSPDSKFLAAGLRDSSISVYNVACKCVSRLLAANQGQGQGQGQGHNGGQEEIRQMPVTSLRFLNDSQTIVATYTSGHIRFWRSDLGSCLAIVSEDRDSKQTLNLALNPSQKQFATVGADCQVLLYDTESRKLLHKFQASDSRDKMDGHRSRVFAVRFADENILLTAGWDDTVQFWDTRKPPKAFRQIYGPHICGDALDINDDLTEIVTGSWRTKDTLEVWDFNSGDKILTIPQDTYASQLYCAQWMGPDTIVCAGGSQNLGRVIDRNSFNTIGQLRKIPNAVFSLAIDLKTSRMAFASSDKIYMTKFLSAVK